MDTQTLLLAHGARYPQMEATDFGKLMYQKNLGGGHLVTDEAACLAYLQREWETAPASDTLCEDLGGQVRVYLGAAKKEGLSPATLGRLFMQSAAATKADISALREDFAAALALAKEGKLPVSSNALQAQWAALEQSNFAPVSHSAAYREAYAPAYRILKKEYAALLPALCAIDRKLAEGRTAVAIDGRCGSGKSTLGAFLQKLYPGSVLLHMDDFFLPPEKRTQERLATPGGNVDYERFAQEVLAHIGTNFSFRPYVCWQQSFGAPVAVPAAQLTIVEGSYSLHTALRDRYDVRIFCEIEREAQIKRLTKREGEDGIEPFLTRWIPLEENYFAHMQVQQNCDFSLAVSL